MLLTLKRISFIAGFLIVFLPGFLYSQQSLNSPGTPGRVLIGDLDIAGNQITVEALIRRTGAGGPNIVSKHTDPSNVNYLLRPTTFELTTTNGFLLMNNPYTLQNNRWYHIAGTYDGAFVRYYVNGCLVVQQPWTGNLVTNNLQACIGNISSSPYGEGFVGQIDEVRIWNVARTEAQIKQNMVNLPNPATYPNLRAYYKFDGNYNNVLGTGFDGTVAGSPAPSLVTTVGDLPTEFRIISVDATDNVICDGFSTGSVTVVPSVETGTTYSLNGGTYQGSNVFAGLTEGTYSVDVRSQEGCILSDVVTIVSGVTLQASTDQTICSGETVQLNASGGSGEYRWDPHPSLSATSVANPTANPTTTTTYTVRSKVRSGRNLVRNGNFEMGNTGFTSGYTHFTSGVFHQGNYIVTGNSPTDYNTGFSNCTDHTAAGVNLLLADGACGTNGVPSNASFWCQTVSVSPDTDYEFSAWMTNVVSNSASSTLSFSINGVEIGNPISTTTTACEWNEFFVTWNSGASTTATICIAEGTGVCTGNDFAVDDISFYGLCELVDIVTITVWPESNALISGTASVCRNSAFPVITFSGDSGTAPYTFTYTVNGGASQTIVSDASGQATISVPTTTSGGFEYEITHVEDANGCGRTMSESVTVTILPDPDADVSGGTSVCLGDVSPFVVFSGNSGTAPYEFTYSVNGGPAQSVISNGSGQASVSVPTTSSGFYTYELTGVTDANGCSSSLTEMESFTVHPLPTIISSNASVCESSTVQLTASGAVSYAWSPATNLSAVTGASILFTAGSTNTYIITGTDANNCVNTASITVTVNPLPTVNAGPDLFGCENDTHTLFASGTALSYTWNNGVVNGIPFVAPVGITSYTVTGINANGCQNSDIMVINIQEAPEISFTVQQDGYCYPVTAQFINTTTDVQNCLWILDNGDSISGCTNNTSVFNQAGVYGLTLQAESLNGCVSQLYQDSMVIIDPYPVASFVVSPEPVSILNPEVKFSNTSWGASSYTWNFGDDSFVSNEISPIHVYPDDKGTIYNVSLIAVSENGCMDTIVSVVTIMEELIFYIPNTFTPDGNQFNQVFLPVFTTGFDPFNYSLLIFNRWGEKVFESHNPTVGWDGTYGGKMCQDGTYTWEIEVKIPTVDDRRTFVGYVNLLR